MALLGSMEAGEQQLKIRQAALAHALEVAQAAEAKHAAEAERLRQHYRYPGDDSDAGGRKASVSSPLRDRPQREATAADRPRATQRDGATAVAAPTAAARSRVAMRPTPAQAAPPLRARAVRTTPARQEGAAAAAAAARGGVAEDEEEKDTAESEELLLKIDAVAPIRRWPDWAVAMLRARKFSSHQEVLVLGIFMYANGVRRDILSEWLRTRYRTERVVEGERRPSGALPEAWLKRLQGYLDRVDWEDPTLWTYSLAADDFTYMDGRPKSRKGRPQGLLGVVAEWAQKGAH